MDPGLLGRDRELAELADLRAAAAGGSGALTLIAGEAGIGKTFRRSGRGCGCSTEVITWACGCSWRRRPVPRWVSSRRR